MSSCGVAHSLLLEEADHQQCLGSVLCALASSSTAHPHHLCCLLPAAAASCLCRRCCTSSPAPLASCCCWRCRVGSCTCCLMLCWTLRRMPWRWMQQTGWTGPVMQQRTTQASAWRYWLESKARGTATAAAAAGNSTRRCVRECVACSLSHQASTGSGQCSFGRDWSRSRVSAVHVCCVLIQRLCQAC